MADSLHLTVHAGEHARNDCPVTVTLPWRYADVGSISLIEVKSGKAIHAQTERIGQQVALTWMIDGLKAGETTELTVAPSSKKSSPQNPDRGVTLVSHETESKIDVLVKGKLFTAYNYGPEWVRPFLHPVLGPGDTQVTRSWPIVPDVPGETTDHPHHKSIWVAYGECDKVDNWSEEPGHGWQRHQAFQALESGPVFGRIAAKNAWCYHNERKQFEEIRDMRFYALPGGKRLFDVAVTFRMTEKDVTFRDTKEGGLISVRVASSMDVPRGGRIENGYGGINEEETWGKRAPWCDYSGIVEDKHVGIAILDHETNPRYPTGWHVRDYGLMTANCFAWSYYRPEAKQKGHMKFKKGSKTTWRYRLYIHRGDAQKGKVADRFHDFVAPPKVTIG